MNCPGCGTKVEDGTAICPSCDYIIDASFISTNAPQDTGDEPPPARKPATSPRPRTASGARGGTSTRPTVRNSPGTAARPRVTTASGARPAAPALPDEDATNIKNMDEIARGAPPRAASGRPSTSSRGAAPRSGGASARPAAPAPRRQPQTELDPSDVNYVPPRDTSNTGTGQIVAPEQVMEDFREFMGVLGLSDKIAFVGGTVVILSAFFPWKETAAEGDILGLMSLGLVAVLAAAGVLGTIAVRVRRLMPNLNVLIPWLAQLGLSIFCILWCIVFMKLSYDATEVPSPIGNATIMNSSPSMGVFLGLLGAVTSLAGTLLGLKEKPAS